VEIVKIRSFRNEVEVVSAFYIESGRSELAEDDRWQTAQDHSWGYVGHSLSMRRRATG
jgi:hypothetical protein